MRVLGLDTSLTACSVALLDAGQVRASLSEPMQRGHQERLALLVQEVMTTARADMSDLDRIAVVVGPGSFTGVRVGLAFGKGLALALDQPCVGVGGLEALAMSSGRDGLVAAAVDAKRGQLYLQLFDGRAAITAPAALDLPAAAARLVDAARGRPLTLVGSGAALLTEAVPQAEVLPIETASPVVVARLGSAAAAVPARPLYLRAPDARLPA